jgi:diguanylate cyclase (GGDEF)-like protein
MLASRYAREYVAVSALAGSVWGLFIVLMPELDEISRLLVTLLLVGMVGGAITTNVALIYAYFSFVLPILLPLSIKAFLVGGLMWNLIGASLIVYSFFLLTTATNLHRILRDSIFLRFQSERLFSELERVKGQLEAAVARLSCLSSIDDMTGISNRRSFDAAISREWSRAGRYTKTIALLFIDVDYFKRYNDQYMHQAGDKALANVAGVLNQHARRSADMAARYGGEEFALILTDTCEKDTMEIAESLRKGVENLGIEHRGSECADFLTVSIGVAMAAQPSSEDYSPLITAADRALYKAKADGRNRVVMDAAPLRVT